MLRQNGDANEAITKDTQYALLKGRYLQLQAFEKEQNPELELEIDSPETTGIVMEGGLEKKGDDFLGRYKLRYFILRDNCRLEYYIENPDGDFTIKPRGIINLAHVNRIEKFRSPDRKFGFNIYTNPGRVYWLSAECEADRESWMHDLQKQIDDFETHHFKNGISKIEKLRAKRRRETIERIREGGICRRRGRPLEFARITKKSKLPNYISPDMSSDEDDFEDELLELSKKKRTALTGVAKRQGSMVCIPMLKNQIARGDMKDVELQVPEKIEKMDLLSTLFVELVIDLKFLENFRFHKIVGLDIPLLSETELKELLPQIGPRARLCDRCSRMRESKLASHIPVRHDNLSEVFEELGLSLEYLQIFYNHEVTPADLHLLKEEELQMLIPALGPRLRLMDYAARTRELYLNVVRENGEEAKNVMEVKEEIDHDHVIRELEAEKTLQRVGSIHSSFHANLKPQLFRTMSSSSITQPPQFPHLALRTSQPSSPLSQTLKSLSRFSSPHASPRNPVHFFGGRPLLSPKPPNSPTEKDSGNFLDTLSSSFQSFTSSSTKYFNSEESPTPKSVGDYQLPDSSEPPGDEKSLVGDEPPTVHESPAVNEPSVVAESPVKTGKRGTEKLESKSDEKKRGGLETEVAPNVDVETRTRQLIAFFETRAEGSPSTASDGLQGLFVTMKNMFRIQRKKNPLPLSRGSGSGSELGDTATNSVKSL